MASNPNVVEWEVFVAEVSTFQTSPGVPTVRPGRARYPRIPSGQGIDPRVRKFLQSWAGRQQEAYLDSATLVWDDQGRLTVNQDGLFNVFGNSTSITSYDDADMPAAPAVAGVMYRNNHTHVVHISDGAGNYRTALGVIIP